MSEQWRDIPGWEGLYQVSNEGRVRSMRIWNGYPAPRLLKSRKNRYGYPYVSLNNNPERQMTASVHKLVTAAFIGMRPKGYEVNHKNGDKADNRLENLEYVTPSQNHLHRVHVLGKAPKSGNGPKGATHPKAKLTEQQVIDVFRLLARGYNQTDIARLYSVTFQAIHDIIKGKNWKHITAPYLKKGSVK